MIRREALAGYVKGSLWVLPTAFVVGALVAGAACRYPFAAGLTAGPGRSRHP